MNDIKKVLKSILKVKEILKIFLIKIKNIFKNLYKQMLNLQYEKTINNTNTDLFGYSVTFNTDGAKVVKKYNSSDTKI